MRMERGLLTAGIFAIALSGCASTTFRATAHRPPGAEITKSNAQVNLPHFSLMVPPDRGWYLRKGDKTVEGVLVELRHGPPVSATFLMQFMKRDVVDERMKASSAQEAADDYRNLEKRTMIEQGVNKGQYRLGDVVMGDEQVGEKRWYTMKYTTSASDQNQTAALYLYFPKQDENSYFILAHYSETLPPGAAIAGSLYDAIREDFLETMKSLRLAQ